MRPRLMALLITTAAAGFVAPASAQHEHETVAQRNARMAWWRGAKFGMFIHWGVYSVPAGTYDGKQIPGIGEWIMNHAKIPRAVYQQYAREFVPTQYNPEAWAQLAADAGMKYMIITSKHHDGFALFPSAVTTWDIADASPWGKDLIGPLATAARAHGLHFGLYYSQAQDWNHPGGAANGGHWDTTQAGSFDEYLKTIAVPQTREILTRYHPDILWWDTPTNMTPERAALFMPLFKDFPDIITNNRLGGGYQGDTETPEQFIPATGIPGRDWEVCMTMNDTWGYKSYDTNWKSTAQLLRMLSDIVSKGGNFLLNVGPRPDGTIPQASIDRLQAIGRWMKVNSEAIYGTTASPFPTVLPWGRVTTKRHDGGTTLYVQIFDWPADRVLLLPGLKTRALGAAMLAGGAVVPVENTADGVRLHLPAQATDSIISVVKLELAGVPDVIKILPKQAANGQMVLLATQADIHNVSGSNAQVESQYGAPNIGYWVDGRVSVSWDLHIDRPGEFTVVAEYAGPDDSQFGVRLGGQELQAEVHGTGGYERFQAITIGRLRVDRTGDVTLTIAPRREAWKAINLRSVTLIPTER